MCRDEYATYLVNLKTLPVAQQRGVLVKLVNGLTCSVIASFDLDDYKVLEGIATKDVDEAVRTRLVMDAEFLAD